MEVPVSDGNTIACCFVRRAGYATWHTDSQDAEKRETERQCYRCQCVPGRRGPEIGQVTPYTKPYPNTGMDNRILNQRAKSPDSPAADASARKPAGSGLRSCRRGLTRKKLLHRLFLNMQLLSPDRRRTVLQQRLNHAQRLSLERLILRQSASKRSQEMRGSAVNRAQKKPPSTGKTSSVKQAIRSTGCAKPDSVDSDGNSKTRGLVTTSSPRTGNSSYHAIVYIGLLRLATKKTAERRVAIQHLAILQAVRVGILRQGPTELNSSARSCISCGSFEDTFCSVLFNVLPSFNTNAMALGLTIAVRVSVQRWVRSPLSTPTVRVATLSGLRFCLRIWRRIYDARQALMEAERCATSVNLFSEAYKLIEATKRRAWVNFRSAILETEVECGLERGCRHRRMLRAESAKHHEVPKGTALAEKRIGKLLERLSLQNGGRSGELDTRKALRFQNEQLLLKNTLENC